jgi:hypothetical protein
MKTTTDDAGRENARTMLMGFWGVNFDLISTAAGRYWALLIETFCRVTHCL